MKRRIRPWWAEDKDGSFLLWIKYGNQPLELQKGKSAIRVATRAELISTLKTLKGAVQPGELDQLISGAFTTFKTRLRW